ncbi:MAG: hypothetical protein ABL997_07270 [Planctomycetota bacterium]
MRARIRNLHVLAAAAALFTGAVLSAQTPTLLQQAGNSAKTQSQLPVTLNQRTTPGSLIVVCYTTTASGTATVSGGGVSQWNLLQAPVPGSTNVQIFAGVVDGSPSRAMNVTLTSNSALASVSIGEWRGFVGMPLVASVSGSGTSLDLDPIATTPLLQIENGDLVVSMCAMADGTEVVPDPANSWKPLPQGRKNDHLLMAAGWFIASNSGPTSMSWPFTQAQDYRSVMVAFRMSTPPAQMPSLIQHASDAQWNVAGLTIQLPQLPAPGNLLVVCHESNSSSNSRISGCGVLHWTLCVSSAPTIINSEIWAGIVGPNPTSTMTITLGSAPNGAMASVSEWADMPVPLAYQAVLSSGPTGGVSIQSPIMHADTNELVIAMAGIHQGGNTISFPTNGYTQFMQAYLPSTAQSAAWFVPTQPGFYSTTWAIQNSTRWAAPMVVFGGR